MNKRKKLLAVALGTAAIGAYRAIKGKGTFNKIRFADQHEAVARYIESHHPGAIYSPIEQTKNGYSCIITDGKNRYLLYMTYSDDGIAIFDENPLV